MAKTIATIGGYALAPGISKNRRWYTADHIKGAVKLAQERLAAGDEPMVMLTHHGADDDSTRVAGALREVSLTDDGRIRWLADVPDTQAGRDIATLTDTSDRKPAFLEGVSIRGRWLGKVRQVKAPDGDLAEQGDGLAIDGLDFTHKPGVAGARIDTFSWAKGGATETSEAVLITESVQEARVTAITEDTTPAGPQITEAERGAFRALLPAAPHVLEDGLCVTCRGLGETATNAMSKRGPGLSGRGGTAYADPGYQADKKQRYELDTPVHIRAAWSFISKAANAAKYTGAQLKRIKGRIKAAAGKAGITIAAEGWTIGPAFQVTEALAEYMGDPDSCGSYSLSATNGPTTVTVCSYGLDPADLAVILQQACTAAGLALCSLDPDMDGDIDVPGAGPNSDTDGDAGSDTTDQFDSGDGTADLTRRILAAIKGESEENLDDLVAEARTVRDGGTEVTETSPTEDPAPPTEAAASQETEVPAVSETTTTEAAPSAAAATFTQADITAAVAKALDAERAARKAAKKAAQKAKPAESAKPAKAPVAETAPALDIEKIVAERVAAQLAAQGLIETQDQKIERLVAEQVTAAKQQLAAQGGGPGRKGLIVAETATGAGAADPSTASFMKDGKVIPMEQWSEDQRRDAGMALQSYVLGDRSVF